MKIALLGASGHVGSRLLKELVRRGHAVTAIARHPDKIAPAPGVTAVAADAKNPAALAKVLAGHDAVIRAVHFLALDAETLLAAVTASGVKRLLVVGGAGSLLVAPGKTLIEAPDFPAIYKAEAQAGSIFLDVLKAGRHGAGALDWTFLSPSAEIAPGTRTGKFRLGGDQLLVDASGKSHISTEDFAVALIDELERPAHSKKRFTVGY